MNSLDIVVAFGGGIFGAAVGALAAFEFVGLLVIAMTVVQIITGASSDFITFPFGLFGPTPAALPLGLRRRRMQRKASWVRA
ncbi:hypothetical protein ECZU03_26420 [Escherichia coli]|nr:hypothetical protein ECZU03_26420 [Escherichia coli]